MVTGFERTDLPCSDLCRGCGEWRSGLVLGFPLEASQWICSRGLVEFPATPRMACGKALISWHLCWRCWRHVLLLAPTSDATLIAARFCGNCWTGGPAGPAVPGPAGTATETCTFTHKNTTQHGHCDQVQSGQDYVYHVRAVNFIGVGPASEQTA